MSSETPTSVAAQRLAAFVDLLEDAGDEVQSMDLEQRSAGPTATISVRLTGDGQIRTPGSTDSPSDTTASANDDQEGDAGAENDVWCGYCGAGPFSSLGIHNGKVHGDVDPVPVGHEPSDDDLVAADERAGADDESVEENIERVDSEVSDSGAAESTAETDGGTLAGEPSADPKMPEKYAPSGRRTRPADYRRMICEQIGIETDRYDEERDVDNPSFNRKHLLHLVYAIVDGDRVDELPLNEYRVDELRELIIKHSDLSEDDDPTYFAREQLMVLLKYVEDNDIVVPAKAEDHDDRPTWRQHDGGNR